MTVLSLSAGWCAACEEESGRLNRDIVARYEGQGVRLGLGGRIVGVVGEIVEAQHRGLQLVRDVHRILGTGLKAFGEATIPGHSRLERL